MPDKQNFFSSEYMDEHLERPLFTRASNDAASMDRDILLVHDLRALYDVEGTENNHSLQRVWERLAEEQMQRQSGTFHTAGRLHALKQREETAPVARSVRRKRASSPFFTALAALLFLTIMVGSLLALVHFTRTSSGAPPVVAGTPTPGQDTSTPGPDYAYPAPGDTLSISSPSPAGFSGLAWSQDSRQVAASTRGKVWIWSAMADGQPLIFDAGAGNSPVALAWSPGAPRLAVGSNRVQVIDPGNGVVKFVYPALSSFTEGNGLARVTALAWSPDGTRLAVATHDPASGNSVRIWSVTAGRLLYTFTHQLPGVAISSVSWSSDGQYLASANGQSVQSWNASSGVVIFQRAIPAPTSIAWSPGADNAGDLAFADGDTTEVWNVWSTTMVSSYAHTAGGVLAWAPDGKYLASASGHAVVIWDASSGARLYTYADHSGPVNTLAWSQDGNYLASGESGGPAGENVVRVWRA